jgi:hypothetical protein
MTPMHSEHVGECSCQSVRSDHRQGQMFDELVETKFTSDGKSVVTRRFISDEEQTYELDLLEASIAFAIAKARAATNEGPCRHGRNAGA